MPFRVCMVNGTRELDAIPVAKVVCYPMEERDYRPFAQNILCLSGGSLCLRMWAFEVSPIPGSELLAVLYPFAEDEALALHVRIAMEHEAEGTPSHRVSLIRDGKPDQSVKDYHFRSYSGEDLQGVYWGGEISLSLSALEEAGGNTMTAPGSSFPGNFYKVLLSGERTHRGSFFPADWDSPFGRDSMDLFTVVDY